MKAAAGFARAGVAAFSLAFASTAMGQTATIDDELASMRRFINEAAALSLGADRAALVTWAVEIVRDRIGSDALRACESGNDPRPRGPGWARPLAIAWNCAHMRDPQADPTILLRSLAVRLDPGALFIEQMEGPEYERVWAYRATRASLSNVALVSLGLSLRRTPDGATEVDYVYSNAGAARAGIRSGDHLIQVNGQDVARYGLAELMQQLHGEPGSTVALSWKVGGRGDTVTRSIVRAFSTVAEPRVETRDDIIVLTLPLMSLDKIEVLISGLTRQIQAMPGPPRAILLDLRGNQGGAINIGIQMADYFMESGNILRIEGREPGRWDAQRRSLASGVPIYLLVDRATQGSAEIVAAALGDNGRARIIGERTAGQNAVRSGIAIGGRFSIALRSGNLVRPDGRLFDGGIEPHIPMRLVPTIDATPNDISLDEALEIVRREVPRGRNAAQPREN